MNKKIISILLIILTIMFVSGCAAPQDKTVAVDKPAADVPSASSVTITISNFAFSPAKVDITKGTTITWVNQDSAPHTISGEGISASGTLSKGDSFSYTFDTAGTYDYKCGIHPSMKGQVNVQ